MKYYKKSDRTLPRFRISKYRYNLVNRELHEKFIKETGIKVPWEKFKKIAGTISDEIVNIAIEERDGVLLPKSMGKIWLGLFPLNRKAVEHIRAHIGQDRYHDFFKTEDGKISWDFFNVKYKVKNHQYYSFHPYRDFKTKGHHAFVNNPERYKRKQRGLIAIEREKNKKQLYDEHILAGGNKSGEDSQQGS